MNDYMNIETVHDMLKKKYFSCEEFVKMVLKNAAMLSCATGAYITVCREKALEEARQVDKEGLTKPLSGIPVAIKDNICTKDVQTTAGSKILEGFIPSYDATVVKRLKENGAIIIGKTNMDEFGMGSGCENSAYKSTANPVDFTYVPGGSSGGSATAVKMGLAVASLGSDTGGSIRQPSAFCSLYGLKPTYSLVSRYGLIAFASSLDCIGPMCQTTKDCATVLNVIAGADPMDMTTARRKTVDYSKSIEGDVKGLKIGIPLEFYEGCDEDIKEAVLKAVEELKYMGAEVKECSFKALEYASGCYYVISSCEASSNLARYDGVRYGKRAENCENLEDLYIKTRSLGFGKEVKKRIMQGTFFLSEGCYDLYYKKALTAKELIKNAFDKLFEEFDVLITPTCTKRVWKRGEKSKISDEYEKSKCTVAVNLAGLPAMSVPCGQDMNSMPVGMQIIANKFEEEKLLNVSFAYEKRRGSSEI